MITIRWRTLGRLVTVLVAALVGLGASARPLRAQRAASSAAASAPATTTPPRFPHAKHQKLFPQCAGCHSGLTTGDRARWFPDTALCGECHNARDQKKVAWRAPVRTPSNLKFDHRAHAEDAGREGAACATCHAASGATWMQVTRATPERCQSCHTHNVNAHLAPQNRCASCHVALTQATALPASRIASFPKPPSHDAKGFETAHGGAATQAPAQCAVCHARETCSTCHVNASAVAGRFQLAPDARVASLVKGREPRYPVPASHTRNDFSTAHGVAAQAAGASCASCHARQSCQSCHTGPLGASAVEAMPLPETGGASGVQLDPRALPWKSVQATTAPAPSRTQVHPAGFARTHGSQAATDRPSCEGCHTKSYCAQCHAGESTRRFHAPNFVARHAPEAYGRESDCQSCHSREVFCRSCHQALGMTSKGKVGGGYHNGASLWIIQHGQAARQELQNCTTCHQQRDCMQCHSQTGRNINPHGRGFNAEKSWQANRLICLRCHIKDPLGR